MKKILVLMLVLGMASMATAALTITGPSSVVAGGTVTMYVTADAASAVSGETAWVWIDYAIYPASTGDALSNITKLAAMGGTLSAILDTTTYAPDAFKFVGANDPPNPPEELLVGNWVSFDLTAVTTTQGNSIILNLMDANFNIIAGGKTVAVIPEPMTIGLLGLGGLFLRRRK